MGWDYVTYRSWYELKRKIGLLKKQFPTQPAQRQFISLQDWKNQGANWFFESKESLAFPKAKSANLLADYQAFLEGKVTYFNADKIDIGRDYDWLTNPSTNYQYNPEKHWTEVEDLSKEAGDIKFTWEKSRFSFLYTLIRHDYHFDKDNGELVFSEIESWIDANPINQGPNYKCSQEISLRVLNWTFALYYYKNNDALTDTRFQKIIHFIYWQVKHDFENINFSRKTVRNNHAITESLMLYLAGVLFPFFPEAATWKNKGKTWFEEEVAYQVYEDGTFLQFSHNYNRVLLQLLTWAFYLADANGESFKELTYSRAKGTLKYLTRCAVGTNGELPNYGANDGALFFKLNDQNYRDYRPQINALAYYFQGTAVFEKEGCLEDISWLAAAYNNQNQKSIDFQNQNLVSYKNGGIYTMAADNAFAFIKCASYKDRPYQADGLHLDLWYKGVNYLRDAGTYKYNTTEELIQYFNGSPAHNTVMLGSNNQMLKGPRFIWLNWSNSQKAELRETKEYYEFDGIISAFKQVANGISHHRTIKYFKDTKKWVITDKLNHNTQLPIKQYWNIHPAFEAKFSIFAKDANGNSLLLNKKKGWYSSYYGIKEESTALFFETTEKTIKTTIKLK